MFMLPPSPNWHLSHTTSSWNNTLAYACRHVVVLLTYDPPPGSGELNIPSVKMMPAVHKDKVTCVSFCPVLPSAGTMPHLATAGEGGLVKIWDVTQQLELAQHDGHKDYAVRSLCWNAGGNLLSSGGEGGQVIWWYHQKEKWRRNTYGRLPIVCIAHSPHRDCLLAIGSKDGVIYIINTETNGIILHRIRACDSDIHSLCWYPQATLEIGLDTVLECQLLASVGGDHSLNIWNADEGKLLTKSFLPSQMHTKFSKNWKQNAPFFSALHWLKNGNLISTGQGGEVLNWVINAKREMSSTVLHSVHNRIAYNMSVSGSFVWTTSQDRQVVLYDLEKNEVRCILSTFGGFIYCISVSPLDATKVAIGAGDGLIRIWNLENTRLMDIQYNWQGIKGKVTALRWHPAKESQLAFGTDEGRVGLCDVLVNRPPLIFHAHHTRTVYTLEWAPHIKEAQLTSGAPLVLYSCGDGDVMIFNPQSQSSDASSLKRILDNDKIKKTVITEFAWKSDFSAVALGNDVGCVFVLRTFPLVVVLSISAHSKMIQSIKWHPMHTFASHHVSPFQNWMAVGSKDTTIAIYDCTSYLNSAVAVAGEVPFITSSTVTLTGHHEAIADIEWSPHVEEQLLTVSLDGTCQIWNALVGEPLVNYQNHKGRVFACCWNNMDTDMVLTGGDDFMMHAWRPSMQTNKTFGQHKRFCVMQNRKPPVRFGNKAVKAIWTGGKSEYFKDQGRVVEGSSEKSDEPSIAVFGESISTSPKVQPATLTITKPRKPTWFPICNIRDCKGRTRHIADAYYLLGETEAPIEGNEFVHLGFYQDREKLLASLQIERQEHLAKKRTDQYMHIAMWQGEPKETIEEMASKSTLSDQMVALAPTVSRQFWLKTCEQYAKQLAAEGHFQKASQYLICCNKIYEGIELLSTKNLHREAVVMAKCRLPPDDPVIEECMKRWATHSLSMGMPDVAYKCYLSIGHMSEAYQLLLKRNKEAPALELAAALARKSGDESVANSLALKCIQEHMCLGEFVTPHKVIESFPQIKWVVPILLICEELHKAFDLKYEQTELINEQYLPWKKYKKEGNSFLDHVGKLLKEKGLMSEEVGNIEEKWGSRCIPKNTTETLNVISVHLTTAILDPTNRWHHIWNCLLVSHICKDVTLLPLVCHLLLPTGPLNTLDGICGFYSLATIEWLISFWTARGEKDEASGDDIEVTEPTNSSVQVLESNKKTDDGNKNDNTVMEPTEISVQVLDDIENGNDDKNADNTVRVPAETRVQSLEDNEKCGNMSNNNILMELIKTSVQELQDDEKSMTTASDKVFIVTEPIETSVQVVQDIEKGNNSKIGVGTLDSSVMMEPTETSLQDLQGTAKGDSISDKNIVKEMTETCVQVLENGSDKNIAVMEPTKPSVEDVILLFNLLNVGPDGDTGPTNVSMTLNCVASCVPYLLNDTSALYFSLKHELSALDVAIAEAALKQNQELKDKLTSQFENTKEKLENLCRPVGPDPVFACERVATLLVKMPKHPLIQKRNEAIMGWKNTWNYPAFEGAKLGEFYLS